MWMEVGLVWEGFDTNDRDVANGNTGVMWFAGCKQPPCYFNGLLTLILSQHVFPKELLASSVESTEGIGMLEVRESAGGVGAAVLIKKMAGGKDDEGNRMLRIVD